MSSNQVLKLSFFPYISRKLLKIIIDKMCQVCYNYIVVWKIKTYYTQEEEKRILLIGKSKK